MENYMNISAFLIGATTVFFAIFAIHILFWHKERTRFQTALGIIMAIWAVWNLKDIIITFPGMYTEEVLNWIFIIDSWSALTFTILIAEGIAPRWITGKRLSLLALPFAIVTLLYYIWPVQEVIYAHAIFLWFYAWIVVGIGWVKVQRRIKYIRENFSNIDKIDISWVKPIFAFVIVSQLTWLFTSLYATIFTDIVYYIFTILLWLIVLRFSWEFQPITEESSEKDALAVQKATPPIEEGILEDLMEKQQLYLNKNLTLVDLAQALSTNRTYVSNYLSQKIGQTFYDYVNQLRIERVSIPMLKEHPEYKLDYVAEKSGFASISTFRRAFTKLTGQTPRQYVNDAVKATRLTSRSHRPVL